MLSKQASNSHSRTISPLFSAFSVVLLPAKLCCAILMRFFLSALVAACMAGLSLAAIGLDISQEICASTSQATWNCLKSQGYAFAIIQGFQGGNHVNQDLARCVSQARAAGFEYVDTCMSP